MSSAAPFDFIASIVEFHATGNREPELLALLDRFAWTMYHDPLEPPPGVQMTGLERDLYKLRACGGFEGMSDVELLVLHEMDPMLMASVEHEAVLHDMFKWHTPTPRKPSDRGRAGSPEEPKAQGVKVVAALKKGLREKDQK